MKMRWWIGSIGLLLLVGCNGDKTAESPPPASPAVVASPSVVNSPVAVAPQAAQSRSTTVAVPPAPPVLAVPDLIPPTSATARVPQIDAGRGNPFAAVTTTPRVTSAPPASQPQTARPQASMPATARPAASPARPSAVAARAPQVAPNPPVVQAAPNAQPVQPAPNVLPAAAPIARSIAVSGIVQTSGRTSAIVQVPQEGSRYVNEGDRLAGGRVLVKRIEAGTDIDPVVVFEQDGVEISRPVGVSGVL